MNKKKEKNGQPSVEEQLAFQRLQVQEVELKARFWKAQHDIRYYTLEAEKLQVPYDEYIKAQQEKNEKAQKEFQETIEKIREQGGTVATEEAKEEYIENLENIE